MPSADGYQPTLTTHLSKLQERITFFFFSSRRRHTRSLRVWSSDVCSSDLPRATVLGEVLGAHHWLTHFEPGGTEGAREHVGESLRQRGIVVGRRSSVDHLDLRLL